MSTTTPGTRDHRFRRMTGRDPEEPHRAATPLELLFDLTLVVAFSQAGTQTAHLLELGHYAPAVGAFAFSVFAICWAWINCSWPASAFDDDVFFRVATMAQMMGVHSRARLTVFRALGESGRRAAAGGARVARMRFLLIYG
jgi:low temperature requirement protein LtrA